MEKQSISNIEEVRFFQRNSQFYNPFNNGDDKEFTEMFLFLTIRSTHRVFSFTIGGQTKFNEIFQFSICNTMKTVNYKGASNKCVNITRLVHFTATKRRIFGMPLINFP